MTSYYLYSDSVISNVLYIQTNKDGTKKVLLLNHDINKE